MKTEFDTLEELATNKGYKLAIILEDGIFVAKDNIDNLMYEVPYIKRGTKYILDYLTEPTLYKG